MAAAQLSGHAVQRVGTVSPFEVVESPKGDQSFPGTYRLRKTDEYSSVFAFRRVFRGRYFMLHYRPNEISTARLGLVVAKRLAKRASQRNLVKRIVREQFRQRRAELDAVDVIVRLREPVQDATRKMIHRDIVRLLDRLKR